MLTAASRIHIFLIGLLRVVDRASSSRYVESQTKRAPSTRDIFRSKRTRPAHARLAGDLDDEAIGESLPTARERRWRALVGRCPHPAGRGGRAPRACPPRCSIPRRSSPWTDCRTHTVSASTGSEIQAPGSTNASARATCSGSSRTIRRRRRWCQPRAWLRPHVGSDALVHCLRRSCEPAVCRTPPRECSATSTSTPAGRPLRPLVRTTPPWIPASNPSLRRMRAGMDTCPWDRDLRFARFQCLLPARRALSIVAFITLVNQGPSQGWMSNPLLLGRRRDVLHPHRARRRRNATSTSTVR